MAAICNLRYREGNVSSREEDGEYFVLFQIGYEAQSSVEYHCEVVFSPLPGYAPDGFELVFHVLEIDRANNYVVYRMDGWETRKSFPDRYDRYAILLHICAAVRWLIRLVKPLRVDMCTYRENLPEAALRKYDLIASVFAAEGYDAGRSDPYHGKHIWMMQRNDA